MNSLSKARFLIERWLRDAARGVYKRVIVKVMGE